MESNPKIRNNFNSIQLLISNLGKISTSWVFFKVLLIQLSESLEFKPNSTCTHTNTRTHSTFRLVLQCFSLKIPSASKSSNYKHSASAIDHPPFKLQQHLASTSTASSLWLLFADIVNNWYRIFFACAVSISVIDINTISVAHWISFFSSVQIAFVQKMPLVYSLLPINYTRNEVRKWNNGTRLGKNKIKTK